MGLLARIGDHQVRYIKTFLTASIDHLCKYLKVRLEIDLGVEQVKSEEVKQESKETQGDDHVNENGESHSNMDEASENVKDEAEPETIQNMKIHVCQVPGQYIEL